MYIPASTYRLQANCNFQLHQMKDIVDYLNQLGITTIYCAPLFQSRCKSNHGYDVINPNVVNPELGTLDELQEITIRLKSLGMGWLQDIVPNHMAYDYTNVWLRDIFEKGQHSDYFDFFDIDWNYQSDQLHGKVLMPLLEEELNTLIDKRRIKIEYHQQGFFLNYGEVNYPLSWSCYYSILSYGIEKESNMQDLQKTDWQEYRHLLEDLKDVYTDFTDPFIANEMPQYKEKLYYLYLSNERIKNRIDIVVRAINEDVQALQFILDQQFFLLAPYHVTDHQINYRRFFIVNELICLRMENKKVFAHYHHFLKTLLDEGLIQGLRVDHIDGLYDPAGYLESLRELAGTDRYIIVEKILESEEMVPSYWPIQGTSGYEFLSCVNHLFTKPENEDKLTTIYKEFTGSDEPYDDLIFKKKILILTKKMNGELDNLLQSLVAIDPSKKDDHKLREALSVFLASFSVYRTYVKSLPLHEEDRVMIEKTFTKAEARRPDLLEQFQFLHSILLPEENNDSNKEEKLKVLIRLQQFTGPLAAKGIEDTAFYVYNRLISHNEVGDCPKRFGISVKAFHENMKQRLKNLPLSINATSTHDTKRGDDARMRINVLSEIPEAWATLVTKWKHMNAAHKKNKMPGLNDEYFIYQSLIGGFPANGIMNNNFLQRFKDFMIKAVREARTYTDWSDPNIEYEQNTLSFVDSILQDKEFMDSFLSFFQIVKHYGMILSLGQTLIKITAPGIPDTFQGSELWDLNFVDPDNRRIIDFDLRKKYLTEITEKYSASKIDYLGELMDHASDGRIKLFTTWAALNERKHQPALYWSGEYISLAFAGAKSHCLVGYARRLKDQWSITIAPKEVKNTGSGNDFPLGDIWEDTVIILPSDAPDAWNNIFTGENFLAGHYTIQDKQPESSDAPIDASFSDQIVIGKRLLINSVLKNYPVALLTNS
jgi:(1->4)-alpha-D-glucan 1-alpha-D-glucosylmutase